MTDCRHVPHCLRYENSDRIARHDPDCVLAPNWVRYPPVVAAQLEYVEGGVWGLHHQ